MSTKQTWLITGASSGLGTSIALAALQAGHKVIGTARNPTRAREQHPAFESQGGTWIQLDVTSPDTQDAIRAAVTQHDVDVLVNNAGYGVRGALEDLSFSQIRAQMETNFFGALACTRGALPHFRATRRGTVVNISSTAAMGGNAGSSMYCATKYALEGVSEALAAEVAPWNIRVLIVEPGHFRTNFQAVVDPATVSDAYRGTPADEMTKKLTAMHGVQPGDPDLAAAAIVEVVAGTGRGASEEVRRCLRLPLGKDAFIRMGEHLEKWEHDRQAMREITEATVYT